MGSPQYGRLVLDGAELVGSAPIEASSLLWSSDGRRLAAQELVSFGHGLTTRVVVFDVENRSAIAVSPSRRGIANPVSFERDALIYRRWNQHTGDRELCLEIAADLPRGV